MRVQFDGAVAGYTTRDLEVARVDTSVEQIARARCAAPRAMIDNDVHRVFVTEADSSRA